MDDIAGVQSAEYVWRNEISETAVQIDLILDRAYNIVNLNY